MKLTTMLTAGTLVGVCAMGAVKKVNTAGLPPGVQRTIIDQTSHAKLLGVSKEVEGGKTMYEVETVANGKTRDLMLDAQGAVISVEEEVALASIPAPARAAIEKVVGGGKIGKVETLTAGSSTAYEAAFKTRSGRKTAVTVNADGSAHK